MSQRLTLPTLLSVLGVLFVLLGAAMMMVTEVVTKYHDYYVIQVPYQETVHPYIVYGGIVLAVGILGLVIGLGMATSQKAPETVQTAVPLDS